MITPSRSPTPSKELLSIPFALSQACCSLSIHVARLSAILTKPSVTATPRLVTKFPIMVPMLPANFSRIGKPVSRKLWRPGTFSINTPIPTANNAIAPISKTSPSIAATPTTANGATRLIVTNTLAINDMKFPSNTALAMALSTLFIRASIPTNTTIGIAIAVSAAIPNKAGPIKVPTRVNGRSISEQAPISTVNAKALSIALFILLATANTPTNASNGITIAVNARIPLSAEPILILPAILRAMDIASINPASPSATLSASSNSPMPIFFSASANPENIFTNRFKIASINAGV